MNGISVIVCCHNSVARLPETLGHLLLQKTSGLNWEIIVVDNASTDSTADKAIEILAAALPAEKFKVVHESNPGLIFARKKGVETASYGYLLFCDDDNWLGDNYLQLAADIMNAHPEIGILGGMGEAVFEGDKPFWFDEYQRNFAVGDQAPGSGEVLQPVKEVYGAGFVTRAGIFRKLEELEFTHLLSGRKGGKIISGEDIELCNGARFLGYEVWYSRQLKFKHLMTRGRMNWRYLKNLYFGFGRMNIYLHAYDYFKTHDSIPGQGLRFPLWLDTYSHKLKEFVRYMPKVIFKLGKEGDKEVLRYYGMRGELYELWSLKEKYNGVFSSIALFKQRTVAMNNTGQAK